MSNDIVKEGLPILKDRFSIIDKENILVDLDTSKGKEIWTWTMFIAVAPGARARAKAIAKEKGRYIPWFEISDINDRSEIVKRCKEEMARSL